MRRLRTIRLVAVFAIAAACGQGGDGALTPPAPPAAVATITIAPPGSTALLVGATRVLSAETRDAQGNTLTGRIIRWTSSATNIATVSESGAVTAVAAGVTQVSATSESRSDAVTITVRAQPWAPTGALIAGRTLATLTLLANGKALLVGGQTVGAPFQTLATCELYDPATGTWSNTGSLTTGRENHVAMLLADGKVLVAGGLSTNPLVRLGSAEIYDPATGTWSAAGNMAVARQLAAAVRLADGRVVVAGGSGVGSDLNAIATTEIYSPTTGRWTTANPLTAARSAHTAALLTDGSVLVSGGGGGTFAAPTLLSSAERFDPITGAWTATGGVTIARGFHRTLTLANGRVLMIGGSNFVSTVFGTSDLFNPATGTWTPTGSLSTARISHSATLLAGGQVLVAGGANSLPLSSSELYDPTTGSWSNAGEMRVARSNHASVMLANGKVLVAGGQGAGAAASAELFDPTSTSNATLRVTSRP